MKKEQEVTPVEQQAAMPPVEETAPVAAEAPVEVQMPAEAAPADDIESMKAELEELREYKAMMEKDNQLIMDVLDAEPRLAKIFQDLSMGATLREALARHFDPDDLTAQEGDPDYEAWEKNRTARAEDLKKYKEMDEKISANKELTQSEIREFAKENSMTDEQAMEFLGQLDELFSNVYAGLIDRKTLAFLKKAIDADQMVSDAREEGEIEGRNAKIKEQVAPAKVGDGLPKIATADNAPAPEAPVKKKGYIESIMEKS
jgi:hypothetical protein